MTFFPQHFLGLDGIPRWYSGYPDAYTTWNIVSSISFVKVLIFIFIIWERIRTNWQTLFPTETKNSIEWLQNLPAAEHTYSELPTIITLN